MFNPGEEVICVDNGPGWLIGSPCDLTKGKTYIVLEVCDCECGHICVKSNRLFWAPERFRRPRVDEVAVSIEDKANV